MRDIHLICNAHLDPVWQWEWQEGLAEALSTFRIAADFCEQQDGFVFNHNEAVLYQWVEEYDPSLFARIQSLVREDAGTSWAAGISNRIATSPEVSRSGGRYWRGAGIFPKSSECRPRSP